jgi:ATP/maltotriose-dependent transcriptional regulator MalT/DNA-binding MarR family transcriptional regulator
MPKKSLLTVSEKILLHLLEKLKFEDKFEIPYSMTQDGIAEVVKARRSYVSQATKELSEKGLIEGRLSHVKDEVRRRKTYFLTQEGKNEAQKLRENLETMKVKVQDEGKEHGIELRKIHSEKMKGSSILEVIDYISEDGVFDIHSKPSSKPGASMDSFQAYPQPRYFFGRDKELEKIYDFLNSDKIRILAVKGIAGMGKTTIMAKVAQKENKSRSIFWYRFHEWSTLRNLLSHLSKFLEKEKKDDLKLYLKENKIIDVGDVQALLKTVLLDINSLLIFDDFHRANTQILSLFEALSEILNELKGIKIILMGRKISRFYDRRAVLVSNLISELTLEGLDKESANELLKIRNIESKHLEKIYESTKGHPLSLELVEVTKDDMGKGNIGQFLLEEVLARLNENEKHLLRFASVFRYPVHSVAYLSIPLEKGGINHEIIDDLVEKSFLLTPDSMYDIHDVLREFFYNRLPPDVKSAYHKKVAEYFEDEADDLAQIEAQYHHIKAHNEKRAVELAVKFGSHLINRGLLEEFLEILTSISSEDMGPSAQSTLFVMHGDILTTLGEWDSAQKLYERSLKAALDIMDDRACAQAYYKIAAIHYRKGDLDKALSVNKESFDILKRIDEPFEMAKLYNNIGVIHWKLGSFEKASDNYSESLKIAEELGDKRGIARALNNLGILHWEKGNLDYAIESYQKSLEITNELGDMQTEAILFDNLGEAFRKKGNVKAAQAYYEKSLKLSQKLGFRWQIAEVFRNMGKLYEDEEGKKYLKKAFDMFENLGAKKDAEDLREKLNA